MEAHVIKPIVEGMYTIHRDYKHGKPKLSATEKQQRQAYQARRCASKRQAAKNARQILAGRRA